MKNGGVTADRIRAMDFVESLKKTKKGWTAVLKPGIALLNDGDHKITSRNIAVLQEKLRWKNIIDCGCIECDAGLARKLESLKVLEERITELKAEIAAEVIKAGKTLKGSGIKAQYFQPSSVPDYAACAATAEPVNV